MSNDLLAENKGTPEVLLGRNGNYVVELSPPLKWAGGKRWLVPRLKELWEPHQHRRLVEPFVGGMSVALGLRPERARLNDTNTHLINLYQQMRDGLSIPFNQQNDAALFYEKRTEFNELVGRNETDTPEAAAIFYYLMRTAFNGLCRLNRKGEYNVPFGRYKTVAYSKDFQPFEKTLKRWEFSCADFAAVPLSEDDFIYADPPYDGVDFTAYDGNKFDWSDQGRLAEWLAAHKGPVVASNAATDKIRALYTELGFELEEIEAPRRIASNGNRATALEVLCFKNLRST